MSQNIQSYLAGQWLDPDSSAREVVSAIDGSLIGVAGRAALDVGAMLSYAQRGGKALRAMTFHDRAKMLKALGQMLGDHKAALYELSFLTGATKVDSMIDIDGGIATLMVYASKGRRELPDSTVYVDGAAEQLGRSGTFWGQHIALPLQGTAIHINAFNFPVWGMLEKLAPTLLAGVPAVVKPATATCHLTEACFRLMVDSGILPDGAIQLVTGGLGDTLDHLGAQDVVSFTGSADTALMLRSHKGLLANSVRFMAEQDSLNASILGTDAAPDTPEFTLFVKEVVREMTTKAGQKCTAIRRIMVPEAHLEAAASAIIAGLERVTIGDPRAEGVKMGALVSQAQRTDVLAKAALIGQEAELIYGAGDPALVEAEVTKGAFVKPHLFVCHNPDAGARVHDTEAFGPVSTLMPYRDAAHAADLANRGGGSLVASVISHDPDFVREVVTTSSAWHGRIYINDRVSMGDSTGHGAPMPHLVHGGPGRAGGGEEMGGIRGVMHYMQRTAIQGSPDMISALTGVWHPKATQVTGPAHPFRRRYNELAIGETLMTDSRTVTMEDIEHFANFTGDTFYAHMDADAAKRNPFFPDRVAHGYLLLSFAAGLFVDPDEGPVLANTGLDSLRFMKPVVAGDAINVRLSVKAKTRRTDSYGEVRWHVTILNQDEDLVAEYELLTMNAY